MLGCGGACHALVSDSVTPCQNVTLDDLTDGVAVSRGKCDGRSDGSSLKFSRPRDPGPTLLELWLLSGGGGGGGGSALKT